MKTFYYDGTYVEAVDALAAIFEKYGIQWQDRDEPHPDHTVEVHIDNNLVAQLSLVASGKGQEIQVREATGSLVPELLERAFGEPSSNPDQD